MRNCELDFFTNPDRFQREYYFFCDNIRKRVPKKEWRIAWTS